MTTRIKLRSDRVEAWEGNTPQNTLNEGEIVIAIDGVYNQRAVGWLGVSDQQTFGSTALLGVGDTGLNASPLVYGTLGEPADGALLGFESGVWRADSTAIQWNTSTTSGAVTYIDSSDTWATNAALTVITDADGGTFTGSFTAPSFSVSYDPTIGEP